MNGHATACLVFLARGRSRWLPYLEGRYRQRTASAVPYHLRESQARLVSTNKTEALAGKPSEMLDSELKI